MPQQATECASPPVRPENRHWWGGTEPFVLSPLALHLLFFIYAVNCVVFYRDRMDLDVCQFLNGSLLSRNTLFIVHGRAFIQVPPQILPWMAVQAGLAVKWVMVAYSLGYWLYHYVMTLLLYYGFRRRDLATLQVFAIVMYLVHNNFYMYADGMHLIPYALCMLASLQIPAARPLSRFRSGACARAFALAAASSHPFGMPLSRGHELSRLRYCLQGPKT